MPLKGPPVVGLEDALKDAVVDGTAPGQHVVGLCEIPPRSGARQPHRTHTRVGRLDAPPTDGIAAVAGSAVVPSLGMMPQNADQLPDLLGGMVIARLQGLQPLERPGRIAPAQAGQQGCPPPRAPARHHQGTAGPPPCAQAHDSARRPRCAQRWARGCGPGSSSTAPQHR